MYASTIFAYLPHGFISEREVVHAALARRTRPEALEDDVRHPLRGEHVASHDRRRRRRVEETPLGDADLHRCEASLFDKPHHIKSANRPGHQ